MHVLCILLCILLLLLLLLLFGPLAQSRYDGCNGCSFGRHGVLKRDCIPLLKSYRQALKQQCGLLLLLLLLLQN